MNDKRFVTWRLTVAYNGANYAGYQYQPNVETVQKVLMQALAKVVKQNINITVAGRTDAGVHAQGQIVSCAFESRFTSQNLPLALSHQLPTDVAVLKADEMDSDFNARFSSLGKRYVYRIYQGLVRDPFYAPFAWHVKKSLNIEKMNQAAQYLLGENDFESFRSSSCSSAHARRCVWRIEVSREHELGLQFDIRGNAFCHNMVRIIVGTLVDVGAGNLEPKEVDDILKAKDRTKAKKTAPAQGLTLEEVYFADNIQSAEIPEGTTFPGYPFHLF